LSFPSSLVGIRVDGEVGFCFEFGNDFPIMIPQRSFRMVRLQAFPGDALQRHSMTAKGMPQAVVRPLNSLLLNGIAVATWALTRGMMEPSVFACGLSHAARFSGISNSFRRLFLLLSGGGSINRRSSRGDCRQHLALDVQLQAHCSSVRYLACIAKPAKPALCVQNTGACIPFERNFQFRG
jgi:hypothetical protein